MRAKKTSKTIRALIFECKEEGWLCAQCLDYDIAVQAKSLNELYYEMERVLVGHFVVSRELKIQPFEGLNPAPPKFWQIFDQSKLVMQRQDPIPFDISGQGSGPLSLKELRLAPMQLA